MVTEEDVDGTQGATTAAARRPVSAQHSSRGGRAELLQLYSNCLYANANPLVNNVTCFESYTYNTCTRPSSGLNGAMP